MSELPPGLPSDQRPPSSSQQESSSSSSPSTNKPRFKRRKHKKSRVGCPQCKKRKIKCDETLPSCLKCVNRQVRCGYLDYTPRELDMVKLAHWEADGADPMKFPLDRKSYEIIAQQYEDQGFDNGTSSWPLNVADSGSNSTENYYNGLTPFQIILAPDKLVVLPPESKRITSLENYIEVDTVHDPSPLESAHDDTPSDKFWEMDEHSMKILEASDNGEFSLPLIKHDENVPVVDMNKYPSFLNETIPSFRMRVYTKRIAYTSMVYSRFHIVMFVGTLLCGGYGTLLRNHPELKSLALEARGICMNYIIKESKDLTDDNITPILRISTILTCIPLFLGDLVTYKEHLQFSTGPSYILRTIYEDPSKFPKSFPAIQISAGFLMFTTRYVFLPHYDHTFIYEFLDVVKQFGSKYLNGKKKLKITSKEASHMRNQYNDLVKFIEDTLDLLVNGRISPDDQDADEESIFLRYPVKRLFELLQRWHQIIPSEIFTMGSKTPNIRKIFNIFWFALLRILEACIVNCRYIFIFFFDGFFLYQGFKREEMTHGLRDKQLLWFLNYSCRLISFFDRRMGYILSNEEFNKSKPVFLDYKNRLNIAKPMDIKERFITSFKDTVIKEIHYPKEMKKLKNSTDVISQFDQYTPSPSISSSTDQSEFVDLGLFEYIEDIQMMDEEKVDLLNNVNPATSMLNNDFDPRYTDPDFNKPVVYHDASKEFFDSYVEDRQLIVQFEKLKFNDVTSV